MFAFLGLKFGHFRAFSWAKSPTLEPTQKLVKASFFIKVAEIFHFFGIYFETGLCGLSHFGYSIGLFEILIFIERVKTVLLKVFFIMC